MDSDGSQLPVELMSIRQELTLKKATMNAVEKYTLKMLEVRVIINNLFF